MTSALPFAAYLRVYEPLTAFPEPERGRWADYVARGDTPDPVEGVGREHAAALAALLAVPPLPRLPDDAGDTEHAFVRTHDGRVHVCPWRTRLRSWLALVESRVGLPPGLADAFVPAALAETAESELREWTDAHPDLHVHIRTSTWHVPLRWFALFEQVEREIEPAPARPAARRRGGSAADVRRCVYLTTMSQARRRAARTLAVLRRAFTDGPIVAGFEDLARWLEEFHPHSLVELDYGGLVQLLSVDEIDADDSPGELAEALRMLRQGDTDKAGALYERTAERWRRLELLELAN